MSHLDKVLPPDTLKAWGYLASVLPEEMILHGGTAISAYLGHRVSHDLDFFFDGTNVDLGQLLALLERERTTVVTTHTPDTLNVQFGGTKVQFLSMAGQTLLEPPARVEGLRLASLRDLAATKVKVIGDRGALRDYFDLMCIEQLTPIRVEISLQDYVERYGPNSSRVLLHIAHALGFFDDVADDPGLPVPRSSIEAYWQQRQSAILSSLQRHGSAW